MGKQIGEIFTELYDANPKEKVGILKKYDCKVLRELLRLNFDKRKFFDLPEGIPDYKPSEEPDGMGHTTLMSEWKRMYLFMHKLSTVGKLKREMQFLSLLEALDKIESKILVEVKDKKLKGVTLKQVKEAYTDFVC